MPKHVSHLTATKIYSQEKLCKGAKNKWHFSSVLEVWK